MKERVSCCAEWGEEVAFAEAATLFISEECFTWHVNKTFLVVSPVVPTCDNRLLLHFPYTVNFDDVTCHKAKGYSYGEDDGEVVLVYDNDRQETVAEFDGKSRIEVRGYTHSPGKRLTEHLLTI